MASSKSSAPHQDGKSGKALTTVSLTGLDASRKVLHGIYLAATATPAALDTRESPDPSGTDKQPRAKGDINSSTKIRAQFYKMYFNLIFLEKLAEN